MMQGCLPEVFLLYFYLSISLLTFQLKKTVPKSHCYIKVNCIGISQTNGTEEVIQRVKKHQYIPRVFSRADVYHPLY